MRVIDAEYLKRLLVTNGLLTQDEFAAAQSEATYQSRSLEDVLTERGLIKDEELGRLVAEDNGFHFADVRRERIDDEIFFQIPEDVARTQYMLALSKEANGVRVALTEPDNVELLGLLEKRLSAPVIPYYATQRGICQVLIRYKADLKEIFDRLAKSMEDQDLQNDSAQNPIVQLVNMLLEYGYYKKASDIHLEPSRARAAVRFRIDGILYDMVDMELSVYEFIVSRIKILANLRTDEHQAAQDGKFRFALPQGEQFDIRVSVVPTNNGENIVMRLLSVQYRFVDFRDLGLSEHASQKVRRAVDNPYGMILVTGPTGSGKTTSLYTMLQLLNKREVHIATIEDPVEYEIAGLTQIQVNTRTDLTFAKGLRALVRQDPDVIMVGEIRDEETAGIAINSALTGHLVLSTLHTNDAATTLPRLIDMHIEPFLIASTIHLIIAQRLVRKICVSCIESYKPDSNAGVFATDPHLAELVAHHAGVSFDNVRLYRGAGCKVCGQTGYTGRVGIFELLEMSEPIRQLIMHHATSEEIEQTAIGEGMTTMLEDGIQKTLSGISTIEEVLRVARL
ncbi:MAG: hypothetical protein A3J66_02600 [Candidatus Magasanikbacteria bacterium RIFCSPHIGHO2_02_FULL_47_14]|uniref:Bacterial type II secretion system protein E domain-containing protein n=1 Tax=Candidatus Magasanikbacteria bacterium RIFCSPHIGHO2_02_FULL_47_14 TaxID=1798680 RepID=A0A1F6MAU0_9BACT|nr:MAG: hypothetical protein A3J66_02600 [Candidatus Magasanikbacteria bacterium RIFCSPHIGHO2_02_FULL_47_14]